MKPHAHIDTKLLEQIGETFIISRLLAAGILVAKPFFDKMGTDLIGLSSVEDKTRFCRIQCKYRTLNQKTTSITIDTNYIEGAFVLFVYVQIDGRTQRLLCFLPEDIRSTFNIATRGNKSVFRLTISQNTLRALANKQALTFDETKIIAIADLMKTSSPDAEFRRLVSGLVGNVEKLRHIQREYSALKDALHETQIITLQKNACEEQLVVLEEYKALLEDQIKKQIHCSAD